MNQPIQGRKAEEVAALPFRLKLDIQHFADDGGGSTSLGEALVDSLDADVDDENITWEPFESDKPKVDEVIDETPEVVELEPEKPKQDHETNKAFQELRKAKEAADRQVSEVDQWAKDTYGHLGISTFKEYQQALVDQKKREEYEQKGIDYDEVRKIAKEEADTHPDVVRARQQVQEAAVQAELKELTTAHPDIKVASIEDIMTLPNHEEIIKKIKRGYTLKDAYELVNRDVIDQKRTAAAEQAARNKLQSKAHLKPSSAGEAGELFVVPDDVMKMYREVNSKLPKSQRRTEDQMREHYKRSSKN